MKTQFKQSQRQLEIIYQARRAKVLRQIKGGVAIFCASSEKISDRDQSYPFQQEADFFYLTGLNEPKAVLLLVNTDRPKSILFIRDKDPDNERWNGEILGVVRAKKIFKLDQVLDIKELQPKLQEFLVGAKTLHYALGGNESFDKIVLSLMQNKVGPKANFPNILSDARLITSKMRWVKDKYEIGCLRQASAITACGLVGTIPVIKDFASEKDCAAFLESVYYSLGADKIAFPTIVASGSNATVLHHRPASKSMSAKDLVLIDTGASVGGYSGDITRTVPVSGKFTKEQRAVYEVVLTALEVGIKNAKPGRTLNDIHNAVCVSLTEGLLKLGVFRKGTVSKLVKDKAYKFFYMHRTGHPLGLNTHDIEPVYALSDAEQVRFNQARDLPLVAGNVFTIEPGLYFDPKDSTVPKKYRGIGIRIEEDVLITRSGCEVLSRAVPRSVEGIEGLFG